MGCPKGILNTDTELTVVTTLASITLPADGKVSCICYFGPMVVFKQVKKIKSVSAYVQISVEKKKV